MGVDGAGSDASSDTIVADESDDLVMPFVSRLPALPQLRTMSSEEDATMTFNDYMFS